MTTTGRSAYARFARIARSMPGPSSTGILTSSSTRSGARGLRCPSRPLGGREWGAGKRRDPLSDGQQLPRRTLRGPADARPEATSARKTPAGPCSVPTAPREPPRGRRSLASVPRKRPVEPPMPPHSEAQAAPPRATRCRRGAPKRPPRAFGFRQGRQRAPARRFRISTSAARSPVGCIRRRTRASRRFASSCGRRARDKRPIGLRLRARSPIRRRSRGCLRRRHRPPGPPARALRGPSRTRAWGRTTRRNRDGRGTPPGACRRFARG